jgi:hypothetical protein
MGSATAGLGAARLRTLAARWPIAFLLWLAPSIGQLIKFLHAPGAALAVGIGALGVAAALAWAGGPAGRRDARGPPLHLAIGIALCAVFALAYPLATSGLFGGGSDRADALDVTDAALLAGRPVYDTLTYQGAPPTPMPGAVLLAAPFHLLGSAALQNVFWFLLFSALAPRLVGDRRSAAAYLAVFVLFCPGVLLDFATGGDFATNALYVILATWALISVAPDERWPLRLLAAAFFACALSSRPIYIVEAPIAAAALLQRQGWRRALGTMGVVAALLAAINLPMLADNPTRFPLLLHTNLLGFYPRWLHAAIAIPALSLVIACAAFLLRLERGRIWLLSAASLAPMVVPPFLLALLRRGPSASLVIIDGYTLPVALLAGLWVMRAPAAKAAATAAPAGA